MHGLSPDEEIDYWRSRAKRAEREVERMRAERDEARGIARSAAHIAKAYIQICTDDIDDDEETFADLGQVEHWIKWANQHWPRAALAEGGERE